MYFTQQAKDLINSYYFNIPNETHAASFERAKERAIEELNRMKVEDFKKS